MRTLLFVLALGLPVGASAASQLTNYDGRGLSIGDGATLGGHRSSVYGVLSYPTLGVGYMYGLSDAADVAVDASIDFHRNFFQFGPWVRFGVYDEDKFSFAARLRVNGIITNVPSAGFGSSSEFVLDAAPGIAMGIEVAPGTDITVDADVPFLFRFGSGGDHVFVAISFIAGVDHYLPKLRASLGLFLGIVPILNNNFGNNDLGFTAGLRGSFLL